VPLFVLIHSPLVGPTTWSEVARELERRGRQAVVPSLLGVAEAPAPQWRHVPEAVRDALPQAADQILLIGHSGAGLLLPVIADTLSCEVTGLIFLDAFLPPSSGDAQLLPPELLDRLRPLASDGVLPPWSQWFGEHTMRELVPDPALRSTLEREMPRLPLSYFDASVPTPDGWAEQPCAYLLLSPDTYGESATRARNLGWPVADVPDAHHLTIVTDPVAVTDALLALERALIVAE
jgi:pimeloyl-ACP methyl ester carboxylesterase